MGDMDQEELYAFYGENLGRGGFSIQTFRGVLLGCLVGWMTIYLLLILTCAVEVDFDSSPPKDKLKLNFDKSPYVKLAD